MSFTISNFGAPSGKIKYSCFFFLLYNYFSRYSTYLLTQQVIMTMRWMKVSEYLDSRSFNLHVTANVKNTLTTNRHGYALTDNLLHGTLVY